MPPVVVVPAPECGHDEDRSAEAEYASIEDEVLAALGANPIGAFNLFGSENGPFKNSHDVGLDHNLFDASSEERVYDQRPANEIER